MPQYPEITELIADVREQVLYLRELGVDDFRAELPVGSAVGSSARVGSASPNAKAASPPRPEKNAGHPSLEKEGSVERLEDPSIPKISKQERPASAPRAGARLAGLPSLSKRRPAAASEGGVDRPPFGENDMTKAKESTERTPTAPSRSPAPVGDSLFGEIGPSLPESAETVEDIRADIGNCTRCPLSEGRTQIVHTTGNYQADLMFVGEAPGADEDAQGEPFVGRAGQLLNKIIEAIGMKREDVCIGNINRCRPPGNRAPTLEEAHTCRPFLLREIAVVKPKVIVVLGNTALHNLLDTKVGITKVRGKFQDYFGVKVMPTFHPAYLLRDPRKKKETWEDMKMVRDYLTGLKT